MKKLKHKNKLTMRDHIIFLGNRNDVYQLYNAMDVFVLPSKYEGLPVVGVEAQANGLPCIFSDAMTKETKVLDSSNFLSLSEGVQKWAEEILKYQCLERCNEKNKMVESGLEIDSAAASLKEKYIALFKALY